ncbi:metal-dependent hydrolase [Desmospora activa]|uniref:Inner membrane protein n=1 Tax=Desmospora activa DSM 45169 TaxID=1121389 RepID=A0A2T4ZDG7_9BACL|nr:metal-dependent hydrolase [Desmospora activa]PTM59930.1 inner membrane protein [Desmospora activa DSM 45169]
MERGKQLDTVTHALLGYAVYAATKQRDWSKKERIGYAATAIVASELPDIEGFTEVISQEAYLTWHRAITHSYLATPVLALLTVGIVILFNRSIRFKTAFGLALLALVVHISFDLFNTWGTGIWEPLSSERYSLGFLPIIDVVILLAFVTAFLLRRRFDSIRVFRTFWAVILLYVAAQGIQGAALASEVRTQVSNPDYVTFQASFVPTQFQLVAREGDRFLYYQGSLWTGITPLGEEQDNRKAHTSAVKEALKDGEVQALVRFLPDYGVNVEETDADWKVTIFDPRFGRNFRGLLTSEVIVPK